MLVCVVNLVIDVIPGCLFVLLKTVITTINHAIGASGVVSQECKAMVQQYGQTIIDFLLATYKFLYKVAINFYSFVLNFTCTIGCQFLYMLCST